MFIVRSHQLDAQHFDWFYYSVFSVDFTRTPLSRASHQFAYDGSNFG